LEKLKEYREEDIVFCQDLSSQHSLGYLNDDEHIRHLIDRAMGLRITLQEWGMDLNAVLPGRWGLFAFLFLLGPLCFLLSG
jgi:hypothetical protein